MENNILVNQLRKRFILSFKMLKDIIDKCPDNLWNRKCTGYIFSQQLLHLFLWDIFWLKDDTLSYCDIVNNGINGSDGILVKTELDTESKNILKLEIKKEEMIKILNESKETWEKWFNGKDDKWLYLRFEPYKEAILTNFEVSLMQIEHIVYHIGHCEAAFRENNIEAVEYIL